MTHKALKAKSARYTKLVEWSKEDGCFVGSAPPIIGPCCHGDDQAKVYAELCRIVEEWIELLDKDGAPLPAKLVKPDIMAQLKATWGDRVFSTKEVAEMRAAELDGEGGCGTPTSANSPPPRA